MIVLMITANLVSVPIPGNFFSVSEKNHATFQLYLVEEDFFGGDLMNQSSLRRVKLLCVIVAIVIALASSLVPQSKAQTETKPTSADAKTADAKTSETKSVSAKPIMPGKLMLDDEENKHSPWAGVRGKVPFDHDQHALGPKADTCVTCHHTNSTKLAKDSEEAVLKCSVCHTDDDIKNTIEGTNENKKFIDLMAISAKKAYHGNKSLVGCIGCHEQKHQTPLDCDSCHNG